MAIFLQRLPYRKNAIHFLTIDWQFSPMGIFLGISHTPRIIILRINIEFGDEFENQIMNCDHLIFIQQSYGVGE